MPELSYHWFPPEWGNWSFGVRWSIFHEFVCFDLGPVAFAIEWTKEVPDA